MASNQSEPKVQNFLLKTIRGALGRQAVSRRPGGRAAGGGAVDVDVDEGELFTQNGILATRSLPLPPLLCLEFRWLALRIWIYGKMCACD